MIIYLLIGIGIGASAGACIALAWVLPKVTRLEERVESQRIPCDDVVHEYSVVLKHIMRGAAGQIGHIGSDALRLQMIYSICKDSLSSRERRQDIVKLYEQEQA